MNYREIKENQRGMVAIITTLILMIVISLIVIGFTQVTRRNQRQALDAQLSSQAFYAAESGVNLAKSKLKANAYYTKNTCDADSTTTAGDYAINAADNTAITCLLIKPVSNLVFDPVANTSKVSLIKPSPAAAVNSLFISWENRTDPSVSGCSTTAVQSLPTQAGWTCKQPLLRVDLVPLDGSPVVGTLSQSYLQANQYTVFLYPISSSGAITNTAYGPNRGSIVNVSCNSTISGDKVRVCTAQINGMTAKSYGIRMMSLYREAKIELHAAGNPGLEGAQVIVDSTARANDVLKRVQARVSLVNNTTVPDFAVMSDELCKRYLVTGNTAQRDSIAEATACLPTN